MPMHVEMNLVVQFPDVGPKDLRLIEELFDETPEFDVGRRAQLFDLLTRMARMLLTSKAGP